MPALPRFFGFLAIGLTVAIGAGAAQAGKGNSKSDDRGKGLPLYLMRTLDAAAQDSGSPGNMWAGTGIPATNFVLQENLHAGVELAVKAHLRQGADILPTYVDGDGLVHVEVPSGPQPGVPDRAAWNFTFSVNTALPGAKPSLDDYDVALWIDLDPTEKADFLKLKLAKLGPPDAPPGQHNGYGWKAGASIVIPDDEGTDRVSQNSQNVAFYADAIDTNRKQPGIQPYAFGPGQFDVVLSIREERGQGHWRRKGKSHYHSWRELARVHVVFDVVDP